MKPSAYVGLLSLLAAIVVCGDIVEENKDMGMSVIPMSELKNPPRDGGLLVAGVQKGGAAASSGIKTGDVLMKLNDTETNSVKDLAELLDDGDPKAISFKAELWSGGGTKTVSYSATGTGATTTTNTFTFTGPDGDGIANIVIDGNAVIGGGGFGGFGQVMAQPTVVVNPNTRPWLGIQIRNLDRALARAFNVEQKGVLIDDVIVDGPAAKAGMEVGDIIRCVGETEVANVDELMAALGKHKIGDEVMVGALRAGKEETFTTKLVERPADQPAEGVPNPHVFHFGGGNTANAPQLKVQPGQRPAWKPGQPGRFRPFATNEDVEELRKQLQELREEIEKLKAPAPEE